MSPECRPETVRQEQMKPVIIINWHAYHAQKKTKQLFYWFHKEQKDFRAMDSKKPGQIEELVQEVLNNVENPLIIIVGGDGSVSQAVNGALSEKNIKDYAFLFIPGGTGNDNSKNLGHNHKREIKDALFKQPEIKRIDALKMTIISPDGNEKSYFALAHIGFGASAYGAKKINEKRPNIFGQAAIVLSSLYFKGINVSVNDDVEKYEDIVFTNGKHFAKVFKTDAKIDDGKQNIYFFRRKGLALITELAIAVFKAKKGLQEDEFEFISLDELNPCIDGESIDTVLPGSTIRVSIEKQIVPVIKTKRKKY